MDFFEEKDVTRRDFIKGAAAGAVGGVVAGMAGTVLSATSPEPNPSPTAKGTSREAMCAETVTMRGHEGDMIDAYLARPTGPGPHPGVVVLHHMPGWDETMKEHHPQVGVSRLCGHLSEPAFPRRQGTPDENSASVRAQGRHAGLSHHGRRGRGHPVPPQPALSQRQGRHHRLLFRRPPGLPGRVHAAGDRRCGGLLRRRCRGAAGWPDAPSTRGSDGLHEEPVLPACSGSSARRTSVPRRHRWRKPKRNSRNGGRPMSSMPMTMPGTPSSRWIVRLIGRRPRLTGGKRYFSGSGNTSADPSAH